MDYGTGMPGPPPRKQIEVNETVIDYSQSQLFTSNGDVHKKLRNLFAQSNFLFIHNVMAAIYSISNSRLCQPQLLCHACHAFPKLPHTPITKNTPGLRYNLLPAPGIKFLLINTKYVSNSLLDSRHIIAHCKLPIEEKSWLRGVGQKTRIFK